MFLCLNLILTPLYVFIPQPKKINKFTTFSTNKAKWEVYRVCEIIASFFLKETNKSSDPIKFYFEEN